MRYILTQHYTIEHQDLFNATAPINKTYAKKIGFEYIVDNNKRCPIRTHWWEKIAWLKELLSTLEDGDMVVYIDCDAVIVDGDLKLALHDNAEYGMVQMRHGFGGSEIANWYNAGVIMMLNTKTVRDFLQRVWDRNDDNDERSINAELKSKNYTIGNTKHICSLDTGWNCWDNNTHLTEEIYIKSWHGIKYEEKLKLIKNFLKNKNGI